MKYVGYYTPGPYEREAELLKLSLDALDLPCDIRQYPSRGSWQANTQMKSEVIWDFLNAYPNKPIVYLDVDALVLRRPEYFDDLVRWDSSKRYIDRLRKDEQIEATSFAGQGEVADIAAHLLNGQELLSGTVYFGNTDKCREIVVRWHDLCKQWPERIPSQDRIYPHWVQAWDQRLLQTAIKQTPGVNFYDLPPEYTWIWDISKRYYGDRKPVIVHTAASRLFRDESKIPKI